MRDQIQDNFYRDEFACKGKNCCGHSAPINPTLVASLQLLRNRLKTKLEREVKIKINSGFRCEKHNASKKVGGSPDSQHCKGLAADISAKGIPVSVLYEQALSISVFAEGGIGLYKNRIHVDVRTNGHARWEDFS